jgi:ABC-type bacteriocin/lantibiotic exporter with double-glycine peptidase domain
VDAVAFPRLRFPALAWVNGNHWVAVFGVHQGEVTLFDPAQNKQETIELSAFRQQ